MEWLAVQINQNKPLLEYNSNIKLACEQALCLGKKIARKGKGRGAFPSP